MYQIFRILGSGVFALLIVSTLLSGYVWVVYSLKAWKVIAKGKKSPYEEILSINCVENLFCEQNYDDLYHDKITDLSKGFIIRPLHDSVNNTINSLSSDKQVFQESSNADSDSKIVDEEVSGDADESVNLLQNSLKEVIFYGRFGKYTIRQIDANQVKFIAEKVRIKYLGRSHIMHWYFYEKESDLIKNAIITLGNVNRMDLNSGKAKYFKKIKSLENRMAKVGIIATFFVILTMGLFMWTVGENKFEYLLFGGSDLILDYFYSDGISAMELEDVHSKEINIGISLRSFFGKDGFWEEYEESGDKYKVFVGKSKIKVGADVEEATVKSYFRKFNKEKGEFVTFKIEDRLLTDEIKIREFLFNEIFKKTYSTGEKNEMKIIDLTPFLSTVSQLPANQQANKAVSQTQSTDMAALSVEDFYRTGIYHSDNVNVAFITIDNIEGNMVTFSLSYYNPGGGYGHSGDITVEAKDNEMIGVNFTKTDPMYGFTYEESAYVKFSFSDSSVEFSNDHSSVLIKDGTVAKFFFEQSLPSGYYPGFLLNPDNFENYLNQTDRNPSGASQQYDSLDEASEEEYIFPYSDSTYLDESALISLVEEYGTDILQYGINEMFARHGYKFKGEKWQNYFSEMSWYHPVDGLTDSQIQTYFNDYEKENMKLLLDIKTRYE